MTLHVAIVGAGLGGLAAALFLRKADIDVTVYEQARELHEVGAGIVVPPNMVRPLHAGDWRIESWTARGEISDLLREFEGWDDRLRQLIVSATDTKRWALYDRAPLEWTEGRIEISARRPVQDLVAQGDGSTLMTPPRWPTACEGSIARRRGRPCGATKKFGGRERTMSFS